MVNYLFFIEVPLSFLRDHEIKGVILNGKIHQYKYGGS